MMLATIKHARTAFSHLNPNQVRSLAGRTLRVGLIAASDSGYEAMEEALVPSAAPYDERVAGQGLIFRGGDPSAPASVDLVLYDEGIRAPKGAYVLYRNDIAATLAAILHDNIDYELPLARQFPGFRREAIDRIIQVIARENALFAVATALPDMIPNLVELPWTFGEWASDTAFLTANQVRMAFFISAACGKEIGFGAQKGQMLSIGAGAFGWRAVARELAGKIPFGGGLVAKAAIAYAGTVVLGKGLEFLHREQVDFPRELRRQTYKDALVRGREMAQGWLPERFRKSSSQKPAA
jgi:hypothetical protein